jgi:predicted RNase H-like HicB family nuclease
MTMAGCLPQEIRHLLDPARIATVAWNQSRTLLMQYTVILVPDAEGRISVLVPAAPGCFGAGDSQAEALDHVRDAIRGWLEIEGAAGRQPPVETPALVTAGVAQALAIIDEMKDAGELPPSRGYELEVTTVNVNPAVPT